MQIGDQELAQTDLQIDQLLSSLKEQDVRVWIDGERIRVSAPSGVLTAEQRAQIELHKDRIREHLRMTESRAASDEVAFDAGRVAGEFPLSSAQQRLWFLDRLDPGTTEYNIAAAYELRGPLDRAAMEQALNDLIRYQPSLRTVFADRDGQPLQIVQDYGPCAIEFVDLSTAEPGQQVTEFDHCFRQLALAPFDLAAGPLYRAAVVSLEPATHRVLFCLHHIVADNWSMGIALTELVARYEAYRKKRVPNIVPLSTHYGEYARQEEERLSGTELERLLSFWKAQLAGAPAVLELPIDRQRPPRQTHNGAIVSVVLSEETSEALRAFARQERSTLYPVLLAVFGLILARYSGQNDVVVGSPFANRATSALERVIGLFVSTLPVRVQVDFSATGRNLVGQLREVLLAAQSHQDLPFEKLVEVLRPKRSLASSPIFQVVFALQNTPLSSTFALISTGAMYDLSLFMRDEPTGLIGTLEYNTDLFDRETIERLADHFRQMAEALVANPDSPVGQLPMITPAEHALIVQRWTATATEYPREASVGSLFDEMAATYPDAIAISTVEPTDEPCSASSLTYRALSTAVERVAMHLADRGVRPGALVGLYLDRSIATVIAMLAILKRGAAYVPLDTRDPSARLMEIVCEAGIATVIASRAHLFTSEFHPAGMILIEDALCASSLFTAEEGEPSVDGSCLAYAMFTSGTTGKPKGVCVAHRSIVRLVRNTNYADFGPHERILQFAPLAFDAATLEIWGALLNGGHLVVYPRRLPSARELASILRDHGITTLWLTAGFFHHMVENELAALAQVRCVISGGDVLSPKHVQRLLDAKSDGTVINGYGPTENTTFTTCHVMHPGEKVVGAVPIGKPISNTRVYILDPAGQPVPIGIAGELYCGGDGVAKGYLENLGETSRRFVADPFDHPGGGRLYRTGDLARWRSDGTIEFLGRLDRQVKVRGFRIELEEIEEALRELPQIKDASVIARRDEAGTNVLVAYLVPREDKEIDQALVRRHLSAVLPDYMMPGSMMVLSTLPLTGNGKLDRSSLPEPATQVHTVNVVEPRTLLETQLHAIWEKLLGYSGFGMTDNFFDLGGHSLLAIRLFAQIERIFGIRLPVSTLFQAPTLTQLAAILEHQGMAPRWSSLVAIQPEGTRPPVYLVPGLGGNVVCYNRLARLLGTEQPVYGLQSRGLDGKEPPFERIEPMAAHYINEIRRVQPHGPYHLGGTCFGGLVAYEMAQQLREQGEEVSFLMLLESWPPSRYLFLFDRIRLYSSHARFVISATKRNLKEIFALSPRMMLGALRRRFKVIGEIVEQRDVYRGDRATMYVDAVSTANHRAYIHYKPRPYDGRLLLVIASAREFRGPDTRRWWRGLAPLGYVQREIPVTSSGPLLISPHVEVLAEWMGEALRDADAADPGNGCRSRGSVLTTQAT
jgi:amino acid adenylation domain-containing protein